MTDYHIRELERLKHNGFVENNPEDDRLRKINMMMKKKLTRQLQSLGKSERVAYYDRKIMSYIKMV